jgi:2,3-bisphosphoglycerate-dependent phosphoglycerate mutase
MNSEEAFHRRRQIPVKIFFINEVSMGWPKLLVLVRHGESTGNIKTDEERPGFEVPTYGYELTDRGREQAKITGRYLNEQFGDFDFYYVSYYHRSRETMSLMYPEAKVYEDPRLAEGQRGIWHVLTKEQIRERFPDELMRKKREGYYHYRPWGGENWPDIELRIHSFLGTLNRDYDGKRVVVVVHGHWLILFQRLLHHFSIDEAIRRYKEGVFENASVTIYDGVMIDDRSRLVLREENIVPWLGKI